MIQAEQRRVGWGWGYLPPWTVSAPRNWTALIGGAEECLLSEFMFFENTRRISMTSSEEKSGFRPLSLTNDELRKVDAYWRACNFLSVGMIYPAK